jgi:hypothetical protein
MTSTKKKEKTLVKRKGYSIAFLPGELITTIFDPLEHSRRPRETDDCKYHNLAVITISESTQY